jgi:rhamnulokinase
VHLDEVHRFPNEPVRLPGGLHWDILRIHHEVTRGIARAAAGGQPLSSLGIDAWGVDYGLLDRDGALLGDPYHYRDARTNGVPERAFARVPWERIFRTTGIQLMPINTLYQLVAAERSAALKGAETLLTIPDLLGYWLSGEKRCEHTIASTTQLLDLRTRDWAWELIERLDIPPQVFAPLIQPGTCLGGLLPAVAEETGLPPRFPVVAVASHDTASAVVAVPAENEDFAYISSGTWSLVGVETREPVVSDEAMAHNFTNEGGFGGTIRLLKNVMGLWLLQECRRTWVRTVRDLSYEDIGRSLRQAGARPARRRRRRAQRAALPVHGRGVRPARPRRPRGGHRARQRARADARARPRRRSPGDARARPRLERRARVRPREWLGRAVGAVPGDP